MRAAGARRRNGNGGGPGHPDEEALSRLTGVWSLANWDETLADGTVRKHGVTDGTDSRVFYAHCARAEMRAAEGSYIPRQDYTDTG